MTALSLGVAARDRPLSSFARPCVAACVLSDHLLSTPVQRAEQAAAEATRKYENLCACMHRHASCREAFAAAMAGWSWESDQEPTTTARLHHDAEMAEAWRAEPARTRSLAMASVKQLLDVIAAMQVPLQSSFLPWHPCWCLEPLRLLTESLSFVVCVYVCLCVFVRACVHVHVHLYLYLYL